MTHSHPTIEKEFTDIFNIPYFDLRQVFSESCALSMQPHTLYDCDLDGGAQYTHTTPTLPLTLPLTDCFVFFFFSFLVLLFIVSSVTVSVHIFLSDSRLSSHSIMSSFKKALLLSKLRCFRKINQHILTNEFLEIKCLVNNTASHHKTM